MRGTWGESFWPASGGERPTEEGHRDRAASRFIVGLRRGGGDGARGWRIAIKKLSFSVGPVEVVMGSKS